jgi:hypothetical protein
VVEPLGDSLANELVCVLVEDILEIFAGLKDVRRELWVGAHPPVASQYKVSL